MAPPALPPASVNGRRGLSEDEARRLSGCGEPSHARRLDCSAQGLEVLGCVSSMTSLLELSLRGNALGDLSGLAPLRALRVLDVASNRLASLRGVQVLGQLEQLLAEGNALGSYEADVRPFVRPLGKLRVLRLRSQQDGRSANPCTCEASYAATVLRDLPSLQSRKCSRHRRVSRGGAR
jgi:hypothetical protein